MDIFAVIVSFIPFAITIGIALFFVIKHGKIKMVNWGVSLFPLALIVIITPIIYILTRYANGRENFPSLLLLLLGCLMLDYAFFMALSTIDCNDNFIASLILIIIGMLIISVTIFAYGNDIGILIIVLIMLAICLRIVIADIKDDFYHRYIDRSAVIFVVGSESIVIEYRDDGLQWAVIDTQEKYNAGNRISIRVDRWKHKVTIIQEDK